ncbi:hypothetical protein NXY42_21160 [Bacteroides fragilis]|nr:hypothetical protein [Bacteroides fragilis]
MKKEFMKKIYKSITLVAAILSLSSCGKDWLDRKPADGIPSEDAITNYNDALTARTGMYDGIQETPMLPAIMVPVCFITAMFVLTICRQELKVCVHHRARRCSTL